MTQPDTHPSATTETAIVAPDIPRVTPDSVVETVKGAKEDVGVLDVRNAEEFAAGHVKGAFNLDSTAFATPEVVDKLIAQLEAKSQVVVHCAKSQQRGPASAAALKQRLQELGVTKEVVVMEGGFNKFSELYGSDSSVVETGAPAAK